MQKRIFRVGIPIIAVLIIAMALVFLFYPLTLSSVIMGSTTTATECHISYTNAEKVRTEIVLRDAEDVTLLAAQLMSLSIRPRGVYGNGIAFYSDNCLYNISFYNGVHEIGTVTLDAKGYAYARHIKYVLLGENKSSILETIETYFRQTN
ncbi:hypothetical protein SDC9_58921 [bioreactor metagenome]|uniref:Uncharacterized protein n=1 Tax=bioreactor metagenome TaxID=1076179 RepID=A0A644X9P8_9ZZZZ